MIPLGVQMVLGLTIVRIQIPIGYTTENHCNFVVAQPLVVIISYSKLITCKITMTNGRTNRRTKFYIYDWNSRNINNATSLPPLTNYISNLVTTSPPKHYIYKTRCFTASLQRLLEGSFFMMMFKKSHKNFNFLKLRNTHV